MKRILTSIIVIFFIISFAVLAGWYRGQQDTYNKFQSEECWVNKQTRDIECIQYIP